MSDLLLAKKKFEESLESSDLDLINLSTTLFHPYRMLILKTLLRHTNADFRDLQSNLGLTAGNLASHLRALKKNGLIHEFKEIIGNRMRTSYEITKMGIYEFDRFKESVVKVLCNE